MKLFFYMGSFGKGGAERVVSNLCNELSDKNEITILLTKLDEMEYKINNNVKVQVMNKKNISNFVLKNIIVLKNLIKYINHEKPEAVIGFLNESNMRLLFLKKFHLISKHTKIIISIRNDPNQIYNSKLKYLLMKILVKKADGIVFQTEDAKEYFDGITKIEGKVIPNPINKKFIGKPIFEGTRKKTVINVGRLTTQKNQKLLIDAFFELHKQYPDYTLKIYGVGELKEELQNQINNLQLASNVLLMGNEDKLEEKIYDEGMFVLSSDYEGMPNALMEAMALGLPCISTNCPCGGPKFLIENNVNGILVSVGNKDELAKAIIEVVENKELAQKIGNNAMKISEKLNPDEINDAWATYIKKVITNEH